jgi:hypothetical protein
VLAGCGELIPPRPPIAGTPKTEQPPAAADARADPRPDPAVRRSEFQGDWEAWYLHRLRGRVVGVSQVSGSRDLESALSADQLPEVDFRRDERMVFQTGQAQFVRAVEAFSRESPDGTLRRFEVRARTGPIETVSRGSVHGDRLRVTAVTEGAAEQRRQLKWPDQTRSLFAMQQTLRRRPLVAGETRRLDVLLPTLASVGVLELTCPGQASVAMLDGQYRVLTEVEAVWLKDGEAVNQQVLWTDQVGVIEKTLQPATRLQSFRCTRETAQMRFPDRDPDAIYVFAQGALPVSEPLDRVAFLLPAPPASAAASSGDTAAGEDDPAAEKKDLADRNDAPPVPAIANQSIRRSGDRWQVLVESRPRDHSGFRRDRSAPEAADRDGSALIDAGHAAVVRAADSVGPLDHRESARELAALVANTLSWQPQRALRPASQVLRDRRGGELDHALLLAALLRARGIPARVVFGFSTVDRDTSLAVVSEGGPNRTPLKLTGWVNAWIGDRWIAVDPLTGRFNRADRISLERPAGDADLSAVLYNLVGRLSEFDLEVRATTGQGPTSP